MNEQKKKGITECKSCKKEVAKTAKVCPHCGINNPGLTGKDKAIGCLAFIVLALILTPFIGNEDEEPRKASPEYMLATLDSDEFVKETDVVVARFRYLLKNLSQQTGDDPISIGDMTVATRNRLVEEYGKDVRLIYLMEEANKAISGSKAKVEYAQLMTIMMTLLAN